MVKKQSDVKSEVQKEQDRFQRRFNGIMETLKMINENLRINFCIIFKMAPRHQFSAYRWQNV
jgi:hypothetical protein